MAEQEPTSLTDEEREKFEGLLALAFAHGARELPEGHRLALMRADFNGEEVAVVALTRPVPEDDEQIEMLPLALVITDSMFDRMEQPS